jgi:hypothetical protein
MTAFRGEDRFRPTWRAASQRGCGEGERRDDRSEEKRLEPDADEMARPQGDYRSSPHGWTSLVR